MVDNWTCRETGLVSLVKNLAVMKELVVLIDYAVATAICIQEWCGILSYGHIA